MTFIADRYLCGQYKLAMQTKTCRIGHKDSSNVEPFPCNCVEILRDAGLLDQIDLHEWGYVTNWSEYEK